MNLHHRLYRQASAAAAQRNGERLSSTAAQLIRESGHVASDDRERWQSAIDSYTKYYIARDLLFDDKLASCYETLTTSTTESLQSGHTSLPSDLAKTLHDAAPIFFRTYWARDDASNSAWIADAKQRLERYGAKLSARTSHAYRTPWRQVIYRNDVTRYANWAEAYTLDERDCVFTVIGSASEGNRGASSLETVFHEASHSLVFPDYGSVADVINTSARRKGFKPPDQFWHAVIFFTAGRLAQNAYVEDGEQPYEMFADSAGLWNGDWAKYRSALARYWDPYLSGHGTMTAALDNCVRHILSA